MDAYNDLADPMERLAGYGTRLGQIADLVGLPIEAFFGEAGSADFAEMLALWEAAGDGARSEILACARALVAMLGDAAA